MRKIRLVVAVVMLIGIGQLAGCEGVFTDAGRQEALQKVEKLTDSIDVYQEKVNELATQMEKDKLISEQTVKDIEKVQDKVDELQPVVTDAVKAVLEQEYGSDKLINIITAIQAANTASAPVNPYAPAVDAVTKAILAVLGISTIGSGAYAAKKAKDNNDIKSKLLAVAGEATPSVGAKISKAVNGS